VLPIVNLHMLAVRDSHYLGVMQVFVKGMAVFMQRFMGTSGANYLRGREHRDGADGSAGGQSRPFLQASRNPNCLP